MGSGVSAPYATADEALAAGKTQSEIDAWISTSKAEDKVAAPSSTTDSAPAPETGTVKLLTSLGPTLAPVPIVKSSLSLVHWSQ